MIKKLLSLLVVTVILSSCGNAGKKEASVKDGAVKVEFASLVENPDNYLGKDIVVTGKVVHVCMESGKKLFIVGENPDIRLYIQAGENMPKFPMDLMGSTVEVEGTLNKISVASAEMTKHEGNEAGMQHTGGMKADSCETETALTAQSSLSNIVMDYKSHIVK